MKNKLTIQFKQHFAINFKPLIQEMMVLVYRSTILVHFTMFAPEDKLSTSFSSLPRLQMCINDQ